MRVIGTWKDQLDLAASEALGRRIATWVSQAPTVLQITLLPPQIALGTVGPLLPPSIELGAQNVVWDAANAFTGETTAAALAALGCGTVMIGHSERRTFLGETDAQVKAKAEAVLARGMKALVCIGETYEERQASETKEVLRRQVDTLLPLIERNHGNVVLAYEPAWAISTNKQKLAPDPGLAERDHAWIKHLLSEALGKTGLATELIYGAGVNTDNVLGFTGLTSVDGVLVGGASQDFDTFTTLLRKVEESLE